VRVALPSGGWIVKSNNKFTINSNQGEEVEFVAFGYFFNAYVRSNRKGISGLCTGEFKASHEFNHPRKVHDVKVGNGKCIGRERHVATCAGKGLKGAALNMCVFDLCANFPKALEKQILKMNKAEGKKPMPKRR